MPDFNTSYQEFRSTYRSNNANNVSNQNISNKGSFLNPCNTSNIEPIAEPTPGAVNSGEAHLTPRAAFGQVDQEENELHHMETFGKESISEQSEHVESDDELPTELLNQVQSLTPEITKSIRN